jgi:hypothetical protein
MYSIVVSCTIFLIMYSIFIGRNDLNQSKWVKFNGSLAEGTTYWQKCLLNVYVPAQVQVFSLELCNHFGASISMLSDCVIA